MKEKNRKTCKEKVKMKKNKILLPRKTVLNYSIMLIIVSIEITAILFFYQLGILQINKEMLYWLFSATAQSMAALFAVVGMFAVFRYQLQEDKLRNLYDNLKTKFSSSNWILYFGARGVKGLEDSIIADRVEELLAMEKSRPSEKIENNLIEDVRIIRTHEKARDNVLITAKIPLVAVLITFLLSIIFISFTESIARNVSGLIIFIIILALITFSVIGLFYYLTYSISPRKKKEEKKDSMNGSQIP